MSEIIGIGMIVLLFAGIFIGMAKMTSLIEAIFIFFITAGICGYIYLAAVLITGQPQ